MPQVIHIRDVVHETAYDLGPELRALRVPYEMFSPKGAVQKRGEFVDWSEGVAARTARFAETTLGNCTPGERVLVRLPVQSADDDWWLCEVEAVDGIAGTK